MVGSRDPGIEVLFACYNGAQTLPAMLGALEGQLPTRRPWRIVAVDNASKDETATILRSFAQRIPIEIVHEGNPGKTAALLAGSRRLRGDLTVLTDDDVIPNADWLQTYENAADARPDYGLFGGPIVPHPIEVLDPWWTVTEGYHDVLFAKTDHAEGPVDAAAHIFGPNYMARTPVAIEAIGYMQGLGPDQSATFALGDESVAIEKVVANGAQAWFVPQAPVLHQLRHRYTTLPYMLGRAQRKGRGVAALSVKGAGDWRGRMGFLMSSAARGASQYVRQLGRSRQAPERALFVNLYQLNWHIGAIRGALKGPFVS
jgi:GT2 family glycosyltransferase